MDSAADCCLVSPLRDLLWAGGVWSPELADQTLRLLAYKDTRCLSCYAVPGPGVLHSGSADFESVDDLVEAVGELLQEVSGDSKDDAGIRAICQRMYNTLRL